VATSPCTAVRSWIDERLRNVTRFVKLTRPKKREIVDGPLYRKWDLHFILRVELRFVNS